VVNKAYIQLYAIYNMAKTTIQIEKSTQDKLKQAGSMDDTYDSVINKLLASKEKMERVDFLVETQHRIAKEGRFVELK